MSENIPDIDFLNSIDRGVNLLPDWLLKAKNTTGLLEAILAEVQELYDAIQHASLMSLLDNATGRTLEQYGERVNLSRELGQSNDDYRIAIKAQIQSTASHGSIKQLIDLFSLLTSSNSVKLDEVFPASIVISAEVDSFDLQSKETIANKMRAAKAGGVGITIGLNKTNSFMFADNENNIVPEGQGFSQLEDGSDGGQMDYLL